MDDLVSFYGLGLLCARILARWLALRMFFLLFIPFRVLSWIEDDASYLS